VTLWLLIGANVLVWLAHILLGVDPMDPRPIDLLHLGGSLFEATKQQPWRLLTSTFMHAGLAHLAWNMIALLQLGTLAQRFYGTPGFLLVYFGSGLGGAIASLQFGAKVAVSVGASGAIFGLMGALIASALTKRQTLGAEAAKGLLAMGAVYVVFNLFIGFTKPGIDNAAHIGGLISGALIALGLSEKFDRMEFTTQATKRLLFTAIGASVVLLCLWYVVIGTS
jgi:rhomboid protease GluP